MQNVGNGECALADEPLDDDIDRRREEPSCWDELNAAVQAMIKTNDPRLHQPHGSDLREPPVIDSSLKVCANVYTHFSAVQVLTAQQLSADDRPLLAIVHDEQTSVGDASTTAAVSTHRSHKRGQHKAASSIVLTNVDTCAHSSHSRVSSWLQLPAATTPAPFGPSPSLILQVLFLCYSH
jgi:hypothetical protein